MADQDYLSFIEILRKVYDSASNTLKVISIGGTASENKAEHLSGVEILRNVYDTSNEALKVIL